jgi:hypothetical protein
MKAAECNGRATPQEFKIARKKNAVIEQGEDGMNKLTESYLEALCEANDQYVTPHLND